MMFFINEHTLACDSLLTATFAQIHSASLSELDCGIIAIVEMLEADTE